MNEWREWWTVDGGFTSIIVTHWRAVNVYATDITPELLSGEPIPENLGASPVWLVWAERRYANLVMWHFEGVQSEICQSATFDSFDPARQEQLRRLRDNLYNAQQALDAAQEAFNQAYDWKGHSCAPMRAIAQIGTFELTGAKTEIPRQS